MNVVDNDGGGVDSTAVVGGSGGGSQGRPPTQKLSPVSGKTDVSSYESNFQRRC